MKRNKLIMPLILASLALGGCTPQYVPPQYNDKDYGYMLDSFKGVDGSLVIQKDFATLTNKDGEKKLYPTDIKQEEISYDVEDYDESGAKITKNVKETVYSIYYGKQRNDDDYRVTLTASELKFVSFEKKVDGNYVSQALYTVEAPMFAGTYNGVDEFEFSDYNNCVVIDNIMKSYDNAKLPGYQMNTYHAGNYMDTSIIVVPGLYFYNDTVAIVADFLDLSDGEFFGFNLFPDASGNLYNFLAGKVYSGYYADPTMFLTDVVDEDGNVHNNSYEVTYDDNYTATGITAIIDGKEATFSKERTIDGVEYTFTFEDKSTITMTSSINNFTFTDGKEEHIFAPTSTGFQLDYNETNFVTGDFKTKLTMYYDIDWDTFEDIEVFQVNGVDISNKKVFADEDGRVATTFDASGESYKLKKINSFIGTISYGNYSGYVFQKEHYNDVFGDTFANPLSGIQIVVDDFNYSINESESKQGELYLDETLDSVGFKMGDYSIFCLDSNEDIYVLSNKTGDFDYLLKKSKLDNLEGTYTSDGKTTVRYNDGKLYLNDQETQYNIVLINLNFTYKYALSTSYGYFVPNFVGTIDYYVPQDEQLMYAGSFIGEKVFNSFKGVYSSLGDYGVEHITFTDDGKFLLDTPDGKGGLIKDVEYPYSFSSDGTRYTIHAYVETAQGTADVPFVKTDYALVLETANLFYIDDRLFELRGAYGDGSTNTIFIVEDKIYINNLAQNIRSVAKENNVTTITTNTHVITATFDAAGNYVLKSRKTSEDEGAAITYTDVNKKFADYKGVKFVIDEKDYLTIEASYSSITNAISVQVKKTGAFFAPSVYACYSGNELVLRAQTPFGKYNLYYDGDNPVAVIFK